VINHFHAPFPPGFNNKLAGFVMLIFDIVIIDSEKFIELIR
jgi:hypothetical protein